jgi:hypothetical protein
MVWRAFTLWRNRRKAERERRRAGWRALEELFASKPEVLGQGRLKPHHANRVHLLETDLDREGRVVRLLIGIVRHPKSHPLAPRGEEVLELLEYRPNEETLKVTGGANLTRRAQRSNTGRGEGDA